jgi:cytochrome c biogenesis protein
MRNKNFFERLYNQFNSIRLAIILVIILGVFSLVAILLEEYFPTNFMNWQQAYLEKLGSEKFQLFTILGIFKPYKSFWYGLLLLLLVLNIMICTFERSRGILKLSFGKIFRDSANSIELLENHASLNTKMNQNQLLEMLTTFISKAKYKIFQQQSENKTLFYATSGHYSRLSYILFHVGLIMVVLGGLAITKFGHTEDLWGKKGDLLKPENADFSLRVDDFKIETNSRGQVKDYLATLTVLDNGEEKFTKIVEVNFPLRYKGYTFYQSSYRQGASQINGVILKVSALAPLAMDTVVTLEIGKKFPLTPFNCTLNAVQLVPDFRLDGDSIYSASSEPQNPAVKIIMEVPGAEPKAQWLFLKFPQFHQQQSGPVQLQFLDLNADQSLYTGLQASRKPGSELIWLGIILMSVGLILSFYIFHRQLWIIVDGAGDSLKIHLGGKINKNQELFKNEFTDMVKELKKNLK